MTTRTNQPRSLLAAILSTGLLAGLLDGLAAIIQFTINGGKNPAMIFKYIASAVFGKAEAYGSGNSMVVWGVLFHLLIAMLFTIFFFLVLPRLRWFRENWLPGGIIYGLFVWAVMNRIVVPLSKIPDIPFSIEKAAVAAGILIVCIGIPVSYLANKYYDSRQRTP